MNQSEVQYLVKALKMTIRNHKPKIKNDRGNRGSLEICRDQVTALIVNERIELSRNKAYLTRAYTERLISDAILHGDKHAHTMKMATWWLKDPAAVHKLFKVLVPRFQDHTTSFTRQLMIKPEYDSKHEKPRYWYKCDRSIVELKGHPFPPLEYSNSRPNRNHLHNFLLNEARKDLKFREEVKPAEEEID